MPGPAESYLQYRGGVRSRPTVGCGRFRPRSRLRSDGGVLRQYVGQEILTFAQLLAILQARVPGVLMATGHRCRLLLIRSTPTPRSAGCNFDEGRDILRFPPPLPRSASHLLQPFSTAIRSNMGERAVFALAAAIAGLHLAAPP